MENDRLFREKRFYGIVLLTKDNILFKDNVFLMKINKIYNYLIINEKLYIESLILIENSIIDL